MRYEKQLDIIEKYLKDGEKKREEYRIGVEFEHFIVDSDTFETITYYDDNGIVDTLEKLVENGWTGDYEGEYILGAHRDDKVITLEPGSQFEFSINAKRTIRELEEEYNEFIGEIESILKEKNQSIIAVGYHPVTKIDDIKLLPKKRYDYMFEYFKDKGSHAHNMMKGSAALQVSLDYENEEDYRKKSKVANAISPIISGMTSNAFYFEGEEFDKKNLRTLIWTNMDDARSGLVKGVMDDDFSYRKYGEYLLGVEPIFTMKDGEAINTGNKTIGELFDPEDYTIDELEHLMTMVFPDVRTKGFIEIRMMDSLPSPINFGMVALLKGLFYDSDNVEKLYKIFEDFTEEDINKAKKSIIEEGIKGIYKGKNIIEWGRILLDLSRDGLSEGELHYLKPIEEILNEETTLAKLQGDRSKKTIKNVLESNILVKSEVI